MPNLVICLTPLRFALFEPRDPPLDNWNSNLNAMGRRVGDHAWTTVDGSTLIPIPLTDLQPLPLPLPSKVAESWLKSKNVLNLLMSKLTICNSPLPPRLKRDHFKKNAKMCKVIGISGAKLQLFDTFRTKMYLSEKFRKYLVLWKKTFVGKDRFSSFP